jgi:hypothetical protein
MLRQSVASGGMEVAPRIFPPVRMRFRSVFCESDSGDVFHNLSPLLKMSLRGPRGKEGFEIVPKGPLTRRETNRGLPGWLPIL